MALQIDRSKLNYCVAALDGSIQLWDDYCEKEKADKILYAPDYYIIYPLTDAITDKLAMPALRGAAEVLNGVTLGLFKDPVSTKRVKQITSLVRKGALKCSEREPVKLTGLKHADLCLIIASRHLSNVAGNLQQVLSVPDLLRDYALSGVSSVQSRLSAPLDEVKQSGWDEMVKNGEAALTKGDRVGLIRRGVGVARGVVTWAGAKIAGSAVRAVGAEASRALIGEISRREKDFRMAIVGKTTDMCARASIAWGVDLGLRAALAYGTNKLLEEGIFVALNDRAASEEMSRSVAGTASKCITAAGAVLWVRFLSPTGRNVFNYAKAGVPPAEELIVKRGLQKVMGVEVSSGEARSIGRKVTDIIGGFFCRG